MALTFSYTVAGRADTSDLAVTAVNLGPPRAPDTGRQCRHHDPARSPIRARHAGHSDTTGTDSGRPPPKQTNNTLKNQPSTPTHKHTKPHPQKQKPTPTPNNTTTKNTQHTQQTHTKN